MQTQIQPLVRNILSVFFLASITLAACQGANPASSSSLQGATWVMQNYRNSQGQMTPAFPGSEATATFNEDGSLTGKATCNQYRATYQVNGNKLTIVPGPMTLMACVPEEWNAQEYDFIQALAATASYKIQGDQLTLSDKDGNPILVFAILQPSPLSGPTWQVTMYNNGREAIVGVLDGSEITAVFTADNKLNGLAGCNQYMTAFQVDGDKITIEPAASTKMMCSEPEGVMEQETAYLKALEMVRSYQISGNKLTMRGESDNIVVEYVTK
jgi:heat shock protein HslJ